MSATRTRHEDLPRSRWDLLAYGVCGAYLLLIGWTFLDYGISWDEPVQAVYGDYILRWYASGFHDRSALEYLNLKYYGGLFDVLAQSTWRVIPGGMYEVRHLINALFGLVGVAGAYTLARYLGGAMAGLLAALFLLLTPVYYGHAFNNPKDIPFATLYLFSCYYLVRTIRYFPRIPWNLVLTLGVVVGLTLGVRVGGVLLLLFLLAAFGLWYLEQYHLRWGSTPRAVGLGPAAAAFAPRFLAVCALAYAVMLLWWPWAQVDPVRHPLEALRASARFSWPYSVLFEGRMIPAAELPWYYLPKWLLISLPEFLLLGLAVGVVLGIATLLRRGSWSAVRPTTEGGTEPLPLSGVGEAAPGVDGDSALRIPHSAFPEHLTLILAAAFPVAYAALSGAVVYDGLRHFLFIVPLLAVLAAVSLTRMIERVRPAVAVTVIAPVVLSMIVTAVEMVQLHPYQYIYFNHLFGGGLAGAAGRYETDYWGTSYKEGAEWLVHAYPPPVEGRRLKVGSCSYPTSTEYYLPPERFDYVGSMDFRITDEPEIFLATTRFDCHRRLPGRVLHVVERQGVPILYITAPATPDGPTAMGAEAHTPE